MQGPRAEILLSNPAALELLGLTEDQLLGKTSFDPEWKVIHEDGSPFRVIRTLFLLLLPAKLYTV
jgi:PAS domain-containing protein